MKIFHIQSGGALIISLIMLLVVTLLVTSAIRSSNSNLIIAGNMQMQVEATAAAEQAINQVLSNSANFTNSPSGSTYTINQCGLNYTIYGNQILIDNNNDGTTDYWAYVTVPKCLGMIPIGGTSATISNLLSTNDTYWDIEATVIDSRTCAVVTLHQGVKIRLGLTFWSC